MATDDYGQKTVLLTFYRDELAEFEKKLDISIQSYEQAQAELDAIMRRHEKILLEAEKILPDGANLDIPSKMGLHNILKEVNTYKNKIKKKLNNV